MREDWWPFRFSRTGNMVEEDGVGFGAVGDWTLHYRSVDDRCFARERDGKEHFANSSFLALAQMLMLWDAAYRRIQRECPDDSGEDWAKGDIIVREMERAMQTVDPTAFVDDSYLWPTLLFDMT